MSGNKIDKVIKYTGCKNYLASWIIEHFPESCRDMTYLEPFFGSGAVFFNKAPSAIETVNDLSGDIVNLFKQIRDNHKELLRMIRNTPWSREEYELSVKEAENDIERARRFLIRMWMTVGGNRHLWMNYNPPGKYLFDFNFTREKTIKAAKAG